MQIATAVNQPVPTTYAQNEAELTTARVGTVDQAGTERELDKSTYAENNMPTGTVAQRTPTENTQMAQTTPAATPAATPATTTPAEQTAERQATPQTLPHTASPYPLVGLIGLLSLAAYGVITVVAKRAV